ncbi:MAG: 4-hydroxyphenylpyruvate dioxygenase [Candidatus Eremiobacteraeota bacterium]|nr:4-hydroxyphenylpyruvate dioxygenase [Candidatus Eremiobacteraeota bacterium]
MATQAAQAATALDRLDWDHLHFYVGNAKQAAHYYATAFGFRIVAYAGPETGVPGRASYVLEQNQLRFVLTSSLGSGDPVAEHVAAHGDGIRDVALRVRDAAAAFDAAVAAGARAVAEPQSMSDEHGRVVVATIATYGDTVHTFIERDAYHGPFMPGFVRVGQSPGSPQSANLRAIDHCVGNVGWNEMDRWVDYYAKAFGFSQLVSFDDHDISTEFTALRSKVMSDAEHRVKFPINEPAKGLKKSQIEEYLDFYGGPGIQHVAIATDDIVATVRALRANGVQFLETPATYYEQLGARVGAIDEEIGMLRELSILVDRDDLGYMLQIFTKPLQDRPTLFFEIIQRRGSLSFGKGNFKALFVSIEEEQAKRGNLR